MTVLRLINLAVWLAVLAYMLPGAWAAARIKLVRAGDPMRLAVAVLAVLICGFTLRPMIAPNSDALWAGLYVLSIAGGAYVAWVARGYGRGRVL